MLQHAIEAEVADYIEAHTNELNKKGSGAHQLFILPKAENQNQRTELGRNKHSRGLSYTTP